MKNASLVASWYSLEPHGQFNTAMDVKLKNSPTFIFTIVSYVVWKLCNSLIYSVMNSVNNMGHKTQSNIQFNKTCYSACI